MSCAVLLYSWFKGWRGICSTSNCMLNATVVCIRKNCMQMYGAAIAEPCRVTARERSAAPISRPNGYYIHDSLNLLGRSPTGPTYNCMYNGRHHQGLPTITYIRYIQWFAISFFSFTTSVWADQRTVVRIISSLSRLLTSAHSLCALILADGHLDISFSLPEDVVTENPLPDLEELNLQTQRWSPSIQVQIEDPELLPRSW